MGESKCVVKGGEGSVLFRCSEFQTKFHRPPLQMNLLPADLLHLIISFLRHGFHSASHCKAFHTFLSTYQDADAFTWIEALAATCHVKDGRYFCLLLDSNLPKDDVF
jgi:hypothetical protein